MRYRIIIYLSYILLLSSCTSCKDENNADNSVVWKKRICGNDLIGDMGLGYPIFKNTVVFHSTPLSTNNAYQSVLYGLDTETGEEKWRLTNADFSPKKNLQFANSDYYYQYNNIVVCCDRVIESTDERFIYAIDIEQGKVLWVNELPSGYKEIGRLVRGMGKYAYVDATDRNTQFSLFKINIETGEFTTELKITHADLPDSISRYNPNFFICTFSDAA